MSLRSTGASGGTCCRGGAEQQERESARRCEVREVDLSFRGPCGGREWEEWRCFEVRVLDLASEGGGGRAAGFREGAKMKFGLLGRARAILSLRATAAAIGSRLQVAGRTSAACLTLRAVLGEELKAADFWSAATGLTG